MKETREQDMEQRATWGRESERNKVKEDVGKSSISKSRELG